MARRIDVICVVCETIQKDIIIGVNDPIPICKDPECYSETEVYWGTDEAPAWYFNRRVDKNPSGTESAGRKGTI